MLSILGKGEIMNDVHKLKISNRNPGSVSSGTNTILELDGKHIKGATSVKFEASVNKLSKVTIELLADVEIDADVESILVRESNLEKPVETM